MKEATPKMVELKNYHRPDYLIPEVELSFDLYEEKTKVSSKMLVKANYDVATGPVRPLVLNGENLQLLQVKLDGRVLAPAEYEQSDQSLTLKALPHPASFTLEVDNEINPAANSALEGLYKSGNVFCTQNEPEGFRRITYFIDRSDVMSRYLTSISADKMKYPVLLSNGNLLESGESDGGRRHWVKWQDPFPKPSYLFALVAGDLGMIRGDFKTRSGRQIDLRIYCDKGNEDRCHHALESLKAAMKWDEDVFGLEYDLDIYMIVAVDAFNMGAMENKGLNIFNTSCVLVSDKTATDADYHRVEGVVGHEYFHNWTGNRVTCRDWFQLTLKEGLTVFRDQEFSGDMGSRSVQRIKDVRSLRLGQFSEDGGPMAHPIRPQTYMEINNFYTFTVYNKGAEVIRMVHTLIGKEAFHKGMKKYFELFDGQAVTTEDFIYSMEQGSGRDLSQFASWYSQSGTPVVDVNYVYDGAKKTFTLKLVQSCPDTPGQKGSEKSPFIIPLVVGLLDESGKEVPLTGEQALLVMTKREQEFVFNDIPGKVVPSLNRGFSAPVKMKIPYSSEDLIFLLQNDRDQFNRWDAHQQLALQLLHKLVQDRLYGRALSVPVGYVEAFGSLLASADKLDGHYLALALQLPEESNLFDELNPIPFEAIHEAREFLMKELATKHHANLSKLYQKMQEKGENDRQDAARRDLKNVCLHYLMKVEKNAAHLCYGQFSRAVNMTDELAAMRELAHLGGEVKERAEALNAFYQKWKDDLLVMNKWFSVQALADRPDSLDRVKELLKDPVFDIQIPNFVRSLITTFTHNHVHFHHPSGRGYQFIAEMVRKLDPINPSVASSLAQAFNKFSRMDAPRKALMKKELESLVLTPELSKNVFEILTKILRPA